MSDRKLNGHASRVWRSRFAIGVLGLATIAACDEPTATAPAAPESVAVATAQRVKSEPQDVSPHREGRVKNGSATLHFLDWGGKGPALVLIAGLGDNAHIYDDLAPKLSAQYHVVAITRRGYGQSSRPTSGYAVDTLVDEIIAVLDHLHLDRVYLAGHSVAGNELTRLAVRYPERVDRLVYLDAAADRTAGFAARSSMSLEIGDIVDPPPPEAADLESWSTFVSYQKRVTRGPWTAALEINLWHAVVVDRDGHVVAFSTSEEIGAMMNFESRVYRPEFRALKMPALAIGALPTTIFDLVPWFPPGVSGDSLTVAQQYLGIYRAQIQSNVNGFAAEAPFATTMFVENTTHYLFVVTEAQVLAAIRNFLRD